MLCVICLDGDDGPRKTLPCTHAFHAACLDAWFAYKAICPVCRAEQPRELGCDPPVVTSVFDFNLMVNHLYDRAAIYRAIDLAIEERRARERALARERSLRQGARELWRRFL
jgi:hypothetical protein